MAGLRRRLALLPLALLAFAAALALLPHASANAVLDNGDLRIGLQDTGNLGVCCGPVGAYDHGIVGLRQDGTELDGISPGCVCEGWGVSYDGAVSGYANQGLGSGGLTGTAFSATGDSATSVTHAGDLRVEHAVAPSLVTPYLFTFDVTLTNTGTAPHGDVQYRRTADFDADPTPFDESMSIQAAAPLPPELAYSCSDGFGPSDPLAPWSCSTPYYREGPPTAPGFTDDGPSDSGAMLDLAFGSLAPGGSVRFQLHYGVAPTEADADAAVAAVGASWWAYAQNSGPNGTTAGTPATYILAYTAVGGVPSCSGSPPSAVTGLGVTLASRVPTISWGTPASDGGCPLRGTVLDLRDVTAGTPFARLATVPDPDTSLVGTAPLLACHTYEVRARAYNDAGPGPAASASVAVPPVRLALVTGFHAEPLPGSALGVRLTWEPVETYGCPAVYYTVYRDALGSGPLGSTDGTTMDDPNALPCVRYTYSVYGSNGYGITFATLQYARPLAPTADGPSTACPATVCDPLSYCATDTCNGLGCDPCLLFEAHTGGGGNEAWVTVGQIAGADPFVDPSAVPPDPTAEAHTCEPVQPAPVCLDAWASLDGSVVDACGVAASTGCLEGVTQVRLLGLQVTVDWAAARLDLEGSGGPAKVHGTPKAHCA